MRLGFSLGTCDFNEAKAEAYADLGITVAKTAVGMGGPRSEWRSTIEPIVRAGLEPIVDLRTEASELFRGEWEGYAVPPHLPWKPIPGGFEKDFIKFCSDFMREVYPACTAFEIWGEMQCPILTSFGNKRGLLPPNRYVYLLRKIAELADKESVLTNGGLGVGPFKEAEMEQMVGFGALKFVQAFNLHPFAFQHDPWVMWKFYDWMLTAAYSLARKAGCDGIYVMATEWGYPSTVAASDGIMLRSGVLPVGIRPATEEQQAEIMDACLEIFWQMDMGPVCLMTQDVADEGPGKFFWGNWCGIWRADGTRKPAYDVVKKWGRVALQQAVPEKTWTAKALDEAQRRAQYNGRDHQDVAGGSDSRRDNLGCASLPNEAPAVRVPVEG